MTINFGQYALYTVCLMLSSKSHQKNLNIKVHDLTRAQIVVVFPVPGIPTISV